MFYTSVGLQMEFPEFFNNRRDENRNEWLLNDGVWVLPEDIVVLNVSKLAPRIPLFNPQYAEARAQAKSKIESFMIMYPGFVVASAYETEYLFLLSRHPGKQVGVVVEGSGFNYGSTNLISSDLELGANTRILILAQND